jgi:nucleotide-binding universal stress UspA family protein
MIEHILVAVDDSPGGLAAARAAIALALSQAAKLRAVHVLADGELERALATMSGSDVHVRRSLGATAVLEHVARHAAEAGVPADTVSLAGEPARCILDEARSWPADLIVIGRSGRPSAGRPYLGGEVQNVLEFADQPVLVVPAGRQEVDARASA